MEYTNFDVDFINRTLQLIDQYDAYVIPQVTKNNQYETTLLINCLLGLLVLPKERAMEIPAMPLDQLGSWGISPGFVKDWGKHPRQISEDERESLPEFIHRLRNSIAHLHIIATGNGSNISELQFSDRNGFKAVIPVENLRQFVTGLAKTVKPLPNPQQELPYG